MTINKQKEYTKEEVLKLEDGTEYAYFNPYTNEWHYTKASKNDIAHFKYTIPEIKYFQVVDKEIKKEEQ